MHAHLTTLEISSTTGNDMWRRSSSGSFPPVSTAVLQLYGATWHSHTSTSATKKTRREMHLTAPSRRTYTMPGCSMKETSSGNALENLRKLASVNSSVILIS